MSHQAKLTLRAPPHQPFVQGWPGVPAGQGRPAAHIKGNVEVRLGGKGLKASWLRIELRKIESTPTGENWGELIGRGPIEVWSADGNSEQDSEGNWDLLQTADFPFKIMIPEGLPPSAKLDKQSGIAYEIVTSLCVKVKKGLLRKEDTSSIIQSTHPVTLEKHELHSTWPIYSVPDDHEEMVNQVIARVYRKQTCFGPGDKVELRVILTSKNVSPVKIKAVAVSVRETITFKGSKRQSRMLGPATKTANQRMTMLAQKSQSVGQKLYKGDTKTYDLSILIPKTHPLMTIQTAKHIEVAYTMRIYVDCKNPIILDHLPLTITTVPRATSASIVPKIGFVPGLSAPMNAQESMRHGDAIQRPQSAGHSRQPIDGEDRVPNRRQAPPPRSLSFISTAPSNTSSERTYQAALDRRDTVRTTASGPGLAGRGIPGQIFSYGSYGQPSPSPFGNNQGPVRLAFAGPASIYEGRELNPEENRALFHHSAGHHLGQVFEGQDPVPSVNFDGVHSGTHTPSRSNVGTPSEIHSGQRRSRIVSESDSYLDARPYPHQQPRVHNGSAATSPSSPGPHDAAEMEKERLYRRAREQAERNQRRAAAAAAAAAAGVSPPPQSPSVVESPSRRIVSLPSAANEKQTLYERARREAERYQAGFVEGATFPKEDLPPASSESDVASSQSHSRFGSSSNAIALAAAGGALGGAAVSKQNRRQSGVPPNGSDVSAASSNPQYASRVSPSPVIATPTPQRGALSGFPSAEEEKKRLYEAAKAERDSYLASSEPQSQSQSHSFAATSPPQSRPHSVVTSSSSHHPQSGFPSADEEKRRFEAARAETDAFLRAQQQPGGGVVAGGSGSGSRSTQAAQGSQAQISPPAPPAILVNGSEAAARGLMTAEEEKKMLYDRAKAEVDANQGAGDSGSGSTSAGQAPPYASLGHAPQASTASSSSNATVTGDGPPRPPASADDEKAQLKRYWEAQDAVARHQQQQQQQYGAGNSLAAKGSQSTQYNRDTSHGYLSSSGVPDPSDEVPGAFPTMHQGHESQPHRQNYYSDVSRDMSRESSHVGDDSASIISLPYRSPSVAAGKQRSLPSPSSSPPPTLPSLSFSSLSAGIPPSGQANSGGGGRGTVAPAVSPFAPRIASPNWHEEEEGDDGRGWSGNGGGALPPPLPPKTPLKH